MRGCRKGKTLDGVLKKIFFSALTIDAFDPPEHKSHFDFTLAHPRNVQIQFLEFVKKNRKIKKFLLLVGIEPVTFCVLDLGSPTVPAWTCLFG